MQILIISQTVFYIVFSLTIISLGIMGGIAVFYIIRILRKIAQTAKSAQETINDLKNKVPFNFLRKF
ncbi:hypothetical protein C4572_01260 [Candidatus Parcubacteria bacterium]|nr:MAG: hypothetical protein C4572_01260 [Candidatus Parcubacteria bacterium]